ncbi:serine protease [Vibrio sp. V27_P1S3P104]|uniref:patatin-like phospholipase family protein n=1 Tax=unclassified Vibrio TaxID=2614977 RepID=UPI00137356D5|nr:MULTISPECIES: patatin-like phospholipase family protein [unclassified Vibrio]NAW68991.1 serine protease [Vibrio sp. V28_P6S34P95]NAX04246.1 serine protease [Vibrio sp. V30_P3S12P165]NAX34426.1 serine protease [Vibrio sp. V29_P1S30P107]NAX38831.1 serine protease [Vibrio sp. V27_P1S3P104]NAX39361.1 serine protease [Vibrio sp. V26_P1S5P106]
MISITLSCFSWAQDERIQPIALSHSRPVIALVLAGGGAKGAAHMGVIKALEEMKVPVDIVLGTSMGAYVAGLYATGMDAEEIESVIYSVDWQLGYRDRVSRSQRRVRDKEYEDRYQLTTDLGFGWDGIRAPRGVVQGQSMLRILRETSGNLAKLDSFDDLVIPYRAVATDIIEMQPVVLDKGYLVDAMMASMSVPGALPPYDIDGRWLVDGGVTNNMPVDVAKAMGADVVIAVDISSDYKQQESFSSFLSAANQLSNYLVRRTTERQNSYLSEQDILLKPNVGLMETTEFHKMPDAFIEGYQTASAHQQQLQKLALSSAQYQDYIDAKEQRRRKLQYGDQLTVDNIAIRNHSHYSDLLLKNRLNLAQDMALSTEEIEASIDRLYALDRFKLVRYQYEQADEKNNLLIDVYEKGWGPNYLNFRFFLEDDFSTTSQYSLGASLNFTDLGSQGAELALNIDLGTDKQLEAELYSPLFSSQKTFIAVTGRYRDDNRQVPYDDLFENTGLSATRNYIPISYRTLTGEVALGYQQTLWRQLRVGARYIDGKAEPSTIPDYGHATFTRQGVFVNFRIDSLDDFSMPREGNYIDLEYVISHDDVHDLIDQTNNSSDTVYDISAKLMSAKSFGRHTLVANLDYGEVRSKNSITPVEPKTIGGFLNLSGIPRNSLIGQNKAYTSLVYRYRWFDNDFGLFTSPVYLGASLEYGGIWSEPKVNIDNAPMYVASSIFAGVDSPIGPIMFGYGRTEQNFDAFYLIVGSTF